MYAVAACGQSASAKTRTARYATAQTRYVLQDAAAIPGDVRPRARGAHGDGLSRRREPWAETAIMSASTRTRWSDVGALTSAGTVAATILCCLPFATGIIGASVAAFGA